LAITVVDDLVVLEFEYETKWIAISKDMALEISKGIIEKANSIKPN